MLRLSVAHFIKPTVLYLSLVCLSVLSAPIFAQSINYRFEESSVRSHELIKLLKERDVFEKLKLFSANNLILKKDVTFVLYEGDGPFFDALQNEVLIPYSFLHELYDGVVNKYPQQPEINRKIFSAAVEQMLWFEFGRVLVSQYTLPIRGLEEYTLDNFSTLMLLNLSDLESEFILDAAEQYLVVDDAKSLLQGSSFQNENEFDQHRYRKIVCTVLGLNDQNNVDLLAELAWDSEHLALCRKQYLSNLNDWYEVLFPYLKPDNKMQRWIKLSEGSTY